MFRRTAWLGVIVLLWMTACSNLWNFQDFQPDSPDGSSPLVDATTDEASGHPDATRDAADAADAADAPADHEGGPVCATTVCSGVCVDTMSDAKNCGGCGTACPAGVPCQGGMCICPGTESLCGSGASAACVYTTSDPANCGGCGLHCGAGASCVNSACVCPTTQGMCGTGTTTACVDENTDPNNCGGCGTVCATTASCGVGMCQACGASVTQIMCGAPPRCVDGATDIKNCGGCSIACQATEICKASKCVCPGSQTFCGTGPTAACYDLSNNQNNCGTCGVACSGGTVCQGGNCVCPAGTHSCAVGAVATCLQNTSTSSCGASCNQCPIPANGVPTCDGTSCGQSCPAAATPTLCPPGGGAGAACVNLTTNPGHCGACTTPCSTSNAVESCAASTCSVASCTTGFQDCDRVASNGCEVNIAFDPNNCGSCGHACTIATAAEVCTNQVCTVSACTTAGTADCDGNPANGCEVNTTTSASNCGGCGLPCSTNNATETCAASKCAIAACSAGFADCDGKAANGCEINLTNDASNCGACGNACSQSGGVGTCVGSTCKIVCSPGFADCDGNAANGCETAITTTTNCGACGNACSTSHATEACSSTSTGFACSVTSCNTGFDDCDHNASNGCEINLNTDVSNCGGCAKPCSTSGATESCVGGSCSILTCAAGLADCDGDPKNGCETSITTTSHCGNCNTACSTNHATEACTSVAGVLTCTLTACSAGFADCDGLASSGCEINTATTTANCGTCGHVCTATGGTATCVASTCGIACTSPNADCDHSAANGCEVNTSNSAANCGGCGLACSQSNGTETCVGSTCSSPVCTAPFANCDDAGANGCEVNTSTSATNCGSCGHTCPAGCSGSVCSSCPVGTMNCSNTCATCPAAPINGATACSGATCVASCSNSSFPNLCTNTCVNFMTDAANCGSCGHACATGATCAAGMCQACAAGTMNCGVAPGACVTCPAAPTGGGTACSGSTCMASCAGNTLLPNLCTNTCVNTMTDTNNCGACGTVCATGASCAGTCQACPANTLNCGPAPGVCAMCPTPAPTGGGTACSGSTCVASCAGNAMLPNLCTNTCVNTGTDLNNCGGCGNVCPVGSTSCTGELCVCPIMGQTACGGVCVDTTIDPANCGFCGFSCADAGTSINMCAGGLCQ